MTTIYKSYPCFSYCLRSIRVKALLQGPAIDPLIDLLRLQPGSAEDPSPRGSGITGCAVDSLQFMRTC